jgi:hypothetical protein
LRTYGTERGAVEDIVPGLGGLWKTPEAIPERRLGEGDPPKDRDVSFDDTSDLSCPRLYNRCAPHVVPFCRRR